VIIWQVTRHAGESRMKLLLVAPVAKSKLLGRGFVFNVPFLSLPIIASYTPSDVNVTIVDERIQDVDFDSGLIFVRSAKGDNDRTTILPQTIKKELQEHFEQIRKLHEQDVKAGYGSVYLPDAIGRKYPDAQKDWRWQYVACQRW